MDFGLKIVWFFNQICALIHLKGQLDFQSKSNSCKPKFSLALQVQEYNLLVRNSLRVEIFVLWFVWLLCNHFIKHSTKGWDLGAGAQTVSSATPAAVTAPKLCLGWPLAPHPSVLLRVRVLRSSPHHSTNIPVPASKNSYPMLCKTGLDLKVTQEHILFL